MKLSGQLDDRVQVRKVLQAQSIQEPRKGVFVYDMGQNMVGFPKIFIPNGKAGQVITLRYAEMLYPDLAEYASQKGMIMLENIRAALAQDIYVLKGGDEYIQPRFTFHGYRYLEITGVDQAPALPQVAGIVLSSISEISSSYETSDPMVNKLWTNITWSMRGNFLSIPTDTPARNERMGWSGDINVFSKTATYLAPVNNFLRRHLQGMRDVQRADGRFTDVAPMGGGFGGTLWGSAGIVIPWETYQQYGDKALLAEHYDAMKRYVAFLASKQTPEGILNEGPLGDWLSPEGNKNDNTAFWMSYQAYNYEIMAKVATILGYADDAANFTQKSSERKALFNQIYIDPVSHKSVKSGIKTATMGPPNAAAANGSSDKGQLVDTQASYAIPLALGIFDAANKPHAIAGLVETVKRSNTDDGGVARPAYSLMTGFIGTASISEALSANNQHAEAYRLLTQKTYPSWLYSVANGATSIWERLNSYIPKPITIDEMNDFIFKPLPNNKILNCKIVITSQNTYEKLYPKYFLYVYNNDKFLLSAKKIFKTTSTNYYIFNKEDMSDNSYIGKISSNFLSTEFNIYDNGKKPGKAKESEIRISFGTIVYVILNNIRKRIY